jgi:hypothetical protein
MRGGRTLGRQKFQAAENQAAQKEAASKILE